MGKFQKGGGKTSWKPGQSGNPGGRPKAIVEVAAAARDFTTEGLEILMAIARDKEATDTARTMAVNSLLDRAWGKAPQTIDMRKQIDPREMTDDELIARIRADADDAADASSDPPAAQDDPTKLN